MNHPQSPDQSIMRQIGHFIIHLRWHYQVCILSGGFLLGGFFVRDIEWSSFGMQFFNVHLLLFGGATAYNSYWDKDEGPVGGLKNPPSMQQWMWGASLMVQCIGLVIAMWVNTLFMFIYALSILFFWLYSTPHFRWKGTPVRSLVAIGISTGVNSLLMGYLAAGGRGISIEVWTASLGVACVMLSLYPVSQLFQLDEDHKRGDETFALKFGYVGVIQFYRLMFAGGILLLGISLAETKWWIGSGFAIIAAATGYWIYNMLKNITPEPADYPKVMRIKYGTSLVFTGFIILLLFLKDSI